MNYRSGDGTSEISRSLIKSKHEMITSPSTRPAKRFKSTDDDTLRETPPSKTLTAAIPTPYEEHYVSLSAMVLLLVFPGKVVFC